MVTLDDVAARAGVSRMTASNAMRGKPIVRPATAERVRRAADELGYHPSLAARQLSSGKTGVIGLSVADLDMVFPAELTAEISDEAYRRGYQLIAQQTRLSPDYERAMLGNASAQICDGTIMCWPSEQAESIAEYGRTHPLVLLDGFGFEGRVDCVFTPFLAGAKSAAEHLIEQPAPAAGHRMLILGAVYRSPEELLHASDSPSLRLRGAYEALRDHGLPYDPANVVLSGWTRESGYETMSRILDERRDFDLVFCLTDMIAIGALKALLDHGVGVPRDVAIMGFDGVRDGRYTSPGLSSVDIDVAQIASTCLDLLIERHRRGAAQTGSGKGAPDQIGRRYHAPHPHVGLPSGVPGQRGTESRLTADAGIHRHSQAVAGGVAGVGPSAMPPGYRVDSRSMSW